MPQEMSREYWAATEDLKGALREEMWARCLHEAAEARVCIARKKVTDLFAAETAAVPNGDRA